MTVGDARGDNMNKTLKLVSKVILILLAPQLALGQWSECAKKCAIGLAIEVLESTVFLL